MASAKPSKPAKLPAIREKPFCQLWREEHRQFPGALVFQWIEPGTARPLSCYAGRFARMQSNFHRRASPRSTKKTLQQTNIDLPRVGRAEVRIRKASFAAFRSRFDQSQEPSGKPLLH